jgi:predicted nuclease of predicted toxin-antitoxin system
MKILVDENIPRMTVEGLRALGHDVKDVRGTAQQALPDTALWAIAITETRLLITTDKGFTAYRTAGAHSGILVIRLRQPNRHKINNAVLLALQHFGESDWPDLVVVVRDRTMSAARGGSSL